MRVFSHERDMMTNQLRHSMAVLGLCTAVMFAGPAFAGLNDGVEGLNEEQQAFAGRFLQFQDDMDEKFFGRVEEINGGNSSDVKETIADVRETGEEKVADFYVRVARGDVVEKYGRLITQHYESVSDYWQPPTTFGRYYGTDIHAKSPLMGQVHAAILLQYFPDGTSIIGGTLNLLKGAAQEEDMEYVKNALDVVFENHGVDSTVYRQRLCDNTELSHDERGHERKLACVGATFFARGNMMAVTEENFLFLTEIYKTFIDAYLTTVERRKDDPFTEEDIALQDAMRKNWFEDQMFGDAYSSGGIVPYAAWGPAFLPPLVKF